MVVANQKVIVKIDKQQRTAREIDLASLNNGKIKNKEQEKFEKS